jgi:hypothetical protein
VEKLAETLGIKSLSKSQVSDLVAMMFGPQRRFAGGPLVAPGAQRVHHGQEFPACGGEVVVVPRWAGVVLAALEDSRCDEGLQARREAVPGGRSADGSWRFAILDCQGAVGSPGWS